MDQAIIQNLTQLLLEDTKLREEVMETVTLAPGEILFRRGDPGDTLYLLETGEMRVFTQDPQGQEITINQVGPGTCLGELALIDARPRSASTVALVPSQLQRISREAFLKAVEQSQPLNLCLLQLLSERVRYMTEYVERLGFWARLIANEDYAAISASLSEIDLNGDSLLTAVADSIRIMVKAIREREDNLKERLQQLRIEIDQDSLEREVGEITDTDYFQDLLEQSRRRRQSRHPHS
ncbi:MAG: cyclic nucleotide-binding domain-containing protein [Prochlorotrichaceae cyanobacterium]|jgi:CRP-like cAMP-binding protein